MSDEAERVRRFVDLIEERHPLRLDEMKADCGG